MDKHLVGVWPQNTKWLFYTVSAIFVLLNALFVSFGYLYFTLLPFLILIAAFYFVSLDKVLWFVVFATPLSINLKIKEFNLGASLPSEPLMFGVLLLFLVKLVYEGKLDRRILLHPITLAILAQVLWMMITTFTSTMPWVSFKYLMARLWFLVSFYYFGIYLLKPSLAHFKRFIWLYVLAFSIVIAYTFNVHAGYAFSQETANWVMSPFYNDHTSYGAMLAMFLPPMIALITLRNETLATRVAALSFTLLLVAALVLSYTRAAWISVLVAGGAWLLIYLKVSLRWVVTVVLLSGLLLWAFEDKILMKLEKNRQDSSSNLTEHVQSISNISSDASNLERINRWQAAMRMFRKEPVFGFGPGTYAFKYAPYQFSYEKTIISTNAGDKGNAHSEYIGPLCEQGLPGMLLAIGLMSTLLITGFGVFKRLGLSTNEGRLVLGATLGLLTYMVHGFLNNFLDTDKAAVPFWGFAAFLVVVDLFGSSPRKNQI
jgi:O-antigen ligase